MSFNLMLTVAWKNRPDDSW